MTRNKKMDAQMNLALCQTPPTELPGDKQRELAAALADLLWSAAMADEASVVQPTGDES